MQVRNVVNMLAAVGTGVMVMAGSAMAALPASVSTDIAAGKADGTDLAYELLAFAVAIGIILFLKRKSA